MHPLGPDRALLVAPRGTTFTIDAPAPVVHRLLTALDGHRPVEDALGALGADPALGEIIDPLLEAGVLDRGVERDDRADWARFPRADPAEADRITPVVVGDGDLIERLVALIGARWTPLRCEGGAVSADTLRGVLHGVEHPVVLAVRHRLDAPWLTEIDRLLDEERIRWSQFHLESGRGFFGPAIEPGATADCRDLLARRRCAVDEVELFEALISPAEGGDYRPPAAELAWMLAAFAADVERWLADAPCLSLSTEVEADPVHMALTQHWLLRLPGRPPSAGRATPAPWASPSC